MNKIRISDHFNFRKILKFTLSPVLMMVFMSIYSVVDGFFISNYASKEAFAGVNLIFPVIMILAGIGFMFGTGGSAFVATLLGRKEEEKAKHAFSMVVFSSLVIGIIVSVIMYFLVEPIVNKMASFNSNTSKSMIDNAILYGKIMIAGETIYILQNTFQPFFSTAEKPNIGFMFTLIAGLTNMLFDYIFIGVLNYGVIGAAVASLMGMFIGSVGPFLYFLLNRKNSLYLIRPEFNFKDLFKIMGNGSSEFFSNISQSIVSIIFNIQLLRYIGEDGISAYGIIMYVSFVFSAIFIGYSLGIAPVISYNYGSNNKKELTSLFKKSLIIISIAGILMLVLAESLSRPFSKLFSSGSNQLEDIATKAMMIYSLAYIFMGFSMFGSSFFTALNNGLISILISLLRTLLFQLVAVYIFPLFMGVNGIWYSIVFAELASFVLTFIFLIAFKNKYGYLSKNSDLKKYLVMNIK